MVSSQLHYIKRVLFMPFLLAEILNFLGLAHLRCGKFELYSPLISGAQRLPNGNTLITIGMAGRIIEVTKAGRIVWEYISPYEYEKTFVGVTEVYRSYRYPYDYAPQAEHSEETPVIPPDNRHFRLPGALDRMDLPRTKVAGMQEYPTEQGDNFCVAIDDKEDNDIFDEQF